MKHLVATQFGRQLITVVAVLLGAALMMIGVAAPQAHSQENSQPTNTSSSQENAAPKDQGAKKKASKKQKNSAPKDQGSGQEEETQKQPSEPEEKVLDKDPEGNEVIAGELIVSYKKGASKQA